MDCRRRVVGRMMRAGVGERTREFGVLAEQEPALGVSSAEVEELEVGVAQLDSECSSYDHFAGRNKEIDSPVFDHFS